MLPFLLLACSIGAPPDPGTTQTTIADDRLQGTWQLVEVGAVGYESGKVTNGILFVVDEGRFTNRTDERIWSQGTIRLLSTKVDMFELATEEGPWRRAIYRMENQGNDLICWNGPMGEPISATDKGRVWCRYAKVK